jgi:hypothetical protein
LRSAAERWLVQTQHAPADGVAVATVARGTIVALHGVLSDQLEEGAVLFLECGSDFKLLDWSPAKEGYAEAIAAHGTHLIEAVAISVLMAAIVVRELAIDVVDSPCLRSAWELVSGNDLVAKRSKDTSMLVTEDIPAVTSGRVATADCGNSGKSSGQSELSARQNVF